MCLLLRYMGFVYLIEDRDTGVYKIGVTKGDPTKRLKKLQTGNANELYIKHLFETQWPFRLETMLHNYFKERNEINEWFWLDDPDEFLTKCLEFNSIISSLLDNPFFNKNLK